MVKNINNPVLRGLDSLCGGNDAAIGRVFGITRQSVGQWRRHGSIPRHFTRVFSALTGVTVEEMLEYEELTSGINYPAFLKQARRQVKEEESDN